MVSWDTVRPAEHQSASTTRLVRGTAEATSARCSYLYAGQILQPYHRTERWLAPATLAPWPNPVCQHLLGMDGVGGDPVPAALAPVPSAMPQGRANVMARGQGQLAIHHVLTQGRTC